MRNFQQTIDCWTENVCLGTSHRERYAWDSYWFRGNVLFLNEKPLGRIELGLDKYVVLRHELWGFIPDPTVPGESDPWQRKQMESLYTDSIGVFTCHAGHMVPSGEALHAFLHDMASRNVLGVLENAKTITTRQLMSHSNPACYFASTLQYTYDWWGRYRLNFGPDLPSLPDVRDEVSTITAEKWYRYDPVKAGIRAARRRARKQALEALQLSTTDPGDE